MTEYRFTFELNHRREHGESPGLGVATPTEHRSGAFTTPVGPAEKIEVPVGPYTSQRIQRVELIILAGVGALLPNTRITTWRGLTGWFVEQAGASSQFFSNLGGEQSIELLPVGADRKDVLKISGAAGAALNNLTLAGSWAYSLELSRTLSVSPGYTPQSSSILVDWYLNDTLPTEQLPNLAATASRYLKHYFGQAGGTLVLAQSGNTQITVPLCAGAWGYGPPIILPSDIGLGFGQIPQTPANWTSPQFAVHPRVFVRPSFAGFAAQHLSPNPVSSEVPLTEDTDLFPHVASRRPTHSLWRILLEGNLHDVIIAHPADQDLRRPRDIWRQVIAPIIAGKPPKLLPTYGYYFVGLEPNLTRTFYSRGVLTGLEYLDMAYCLDLYDGESPPLVAFPEI